MGTCTERRYKELTAREWWVQEIFGKRPCDSCSARPINVLAHITLPETRVGLMDPIGLAIGTSGDPVAFKPALATERYYSVGTLAACRACEKAMEQVLAHRTSSRGDLGSSAYVSFDRPPTDRLVVLAS
jgi:hypothetical protein